MLQKPQIAVVIPTFNDAHFLEEALASLKMVDLDVDIIVVDDGTTEPESLAILERLSGENLRVLKQKNAGPAAARNLGITHTQAPYILALDADNKVKPELLLRAIEVFKAKPEVGVVYSAKYLFGAEEKIERPGPFKIYTMLDYNYIDTCAVFRKEAWAQVGGFDPNPDCYEDWDFWLLLYERDWQFYYIDEPLYWYRVREDYSRRQFMYDQKEVGQSMVLKRHKALYLKAISEQEAVLKAYEDSYLFPFLKKIKKRFKL